MTIKNKSTARGTLRGLIQRPNGFPTPDPIVDDYDIILKFHNEWFNDAQFFANDYLKDYGVYYSWLTEAIESKNVAEVANILKKIDEGKSNDDDTYHKRARQNVVLEHGYCLAKLGRNKVFALVKGDIEKPSDLSGVLYIPMDGKWKYEVTEELKAVGYSVSKDDV
jgi:hypothetical protein